MNPENNNEPQTEWQAPPIPEQINRDAEEPPRMSEAATLGNIFFSQGETFADLRRKPRFLLASLLLVLASSIFLITFFEKIGFERITRERIESSSRMEQMPAAEKEKMIAMQTQPFVKYITYGAVVVGTLVSILVGGLIYWLGANAMGGTMTFLRGLSVWVYSSLPPALVSMAANLLVLFLKSPDDIDLTSQTGLIQANPSFLANVKSSPVLGALLATFDLFFIWGWILAAIGLCVVGKISKGAAWAIVLMVALLNIAFRVIGAYFS